MSNEGSWEAGVNNARPGIIMPGRPAVGQFHFQEIAPPDAMDSALVQSVTEQRTVPAGSFSNVLHTVEHTVLEPAAVAEKWYAPGVGLIEDGAAQLVRARFRQV